MPNCVRFITILFNATFRIQHFPGAWKLIEIIMLPKPDKNIHELFSYRLISLILILLKML